MHVYCSKLSHFIALMVLFVMSHSFLFLCFYSSAVGCLALFLAILAFFGVMPPVSSFYSCLLILFPVGSLLPSMGVCTCLPSVIQKLPLSAALRPVQGVGIPPQELPFPLSLERLFLLVVRFSQATLEQCSQYWESMDWAREWSLWKVLGLPMRALSSLMRDESPR